MDLVTDTKASAADSVPRSVCCTTIGWIGRLWGPFLLICITVCLGSVAVPVVQNIIALKSSGRVTTGTVLNKEIINGKGGPYYHLMYEFLTSSGPAQYRVAVGENKYYQISVGYPLVITFVPNDPQNHTLGIVTDEDVRLEEVKWSAVFLLVFVIFGGIITTLEWEFRKQYYLLTWGTLVAAYLVNQRFETTTSLDRQGDVKSTNLSYYVKYCFTVRGQTYYREVKSSSTIDNDTPDGDQIMVLYDPKRPSFNMPCAKITAVTLAK